MAVRCFLLAVGMLASVGTARAGESCVCPAGEPWGPGAKVTLHGKVVGASEKGGTRLYEVMVREMFLGYHRDRLRIYSPATGCQAALKVGEDYLFDAYRRDVTGQSRPGAYSVSQCSRLLRFADVPREDVQALRRRRAMQRANATGITFGLP